MAYYGGRGDYYRGDYYRGRGDPFLGGLIGLAGPLIKKGVGLVAKALGKKGMSVAKVAAPVLIGGGISMMGGGPPPAGQLKVPGVKGAVQRFLPGGATGYEMARRRRMNPANAKALRRALRRVSGFAKLAQRTKRDIGRAATAAGVRSGRRAAPRRKAC